MSKQLEQFKAYRQRMNEKILGCDHLGIKRFFNLDTKAYEDGALDGRTKELLGLVASTVLRCNDCIDYHLIQCVRLGFSDAELHDGLNVALVVGGSIAVGVSVTWSRTLLTAADAMSTAVTVTASQMSG